MAVHFLLIYLLDTDRESIAIAVEPPFPCLRYFIVLNINANDTTCQILTILSLLLLLIKWSKCCYFSSANKREWLEREYVIDGLRSVYMYVHAYVIYMFTTTLHTQHRTDWCALNVTNCCLLCSQYIYLHWGTLMSHVLAISNNSSHLYKNLFIVIRDVRVCCMMCVCVYGLQTCYFLYHISRRIQTHTLQHLQTYIAKQNFIAVSGTI